MAKSIKPSVLAEDVTFAAYGKWQQQMVYCLNKEADWQRYLKVGFKWEKYTANNPNRGFTDEEDENGSKKEDIARLLSNMLEYIAQFVPHFLTHEIVFDSTCLKDVWQTIRQYYNFQQSEANFLKLSSIKYGGIKNERPEHFYRRILEHLQDNLLKADGGLRHNKAQVTKDEDISPTVARLAVHRWLELMDERLPGLVGRCFATELQTNSLKDIQPIIASSIKDMLKQLDHEERQQQACAKIQALEIQAEFDSPEEELAIAQVSSRNTNRTFFKQNNGNKPRNKPRFQCSLCQGWGRPSIGHSMAACKYISDGERTDIAKYKSRPVRSVETGLDNPAENYE